MTSLLTSQEAEKLISMLSKGGQGISLDEITSLCENTLISDSYTRIALALRIMLDDGYFTSPSSSAAASLGIVPTRDCELLLAYHILVFLYFKSAPAAGPALHDQLLILEDGLRRDAIRRKRDTAAGSRRNLKDILEHDAYRVRNGLKLFLLTSFIGKSTTVAPTARQWMQLDLDGMEKVYASVFKEVGSHERLTSVLTALRDAHDRGTGHTISGSILRSAVSSTIAIPDEGVADGVFSDARRLEPQFVRPIPAPPPTDGFLSRQLLLTAGDFPLLFM